MKIVGFYTPEYTPHAFMCMASAVRFGWDAHFKPIPTLGKWVLNCGIKSRFLLDSLGDERLLYVDADARFKSSPTELAEINEPFDIGFHRMNGELLSGTLLLEPTVSTRALLKRWAALCALNPKVWDQKLLDKSLRSELVYELAPEWCMITDIGRRVYPGVTPKIEHLQASREFRRKLR